MHVCTHTGMHCVCVTVYVCTHRWVNVHTLCKCMYSVCTPVHTVKCAYMCVCTWICIYACVNGSNFQPVCCKNFYLFILNIYFSDYAITVVPTVSFLSPSPKHPHSLRQSTHHCSCPWVMHISSLAFPFPILFLTSPSLFCTYQYVLLNPCTFPLNLPLPHSNR